MPVLVLLILLFTQNLYSDWIQSGCDTVISFKHGTGQNAGQDSIYFPKNIFGLPDTNARWTVPASDPSQICSLGLGGEIIISFKNMELYDGAGADFTVFENAFYSPAIQRVFADPAIVGVSYDGIIYYDFPYDTVNLIGCAGITPTNGDKDPFNPDSSGGNSFDLSQIGISKIKYIRIKDITQNILNNPQNPYYDPILTGFDLDAVVALHLKPIISDIKKEDISDSIYISQTSDKIKIFNMNNNSSKYELYSITGNILESGIFENNLDLNINNLESGLYFLIIKSNSNIISKIIIK